MQCIFTVTFRLDWVRVNGCPAGLEPLVEISELLHDPKVRFEHVNLFSYFDDKKFTYDMIILFYNGCYNFYGCLNPCFIDKNILNKIITADLFLNSISFSSITRRGGKNSIINR